MTLTTSTTLRRRRLASAALALPLALAMTGTAFATGAGSDSAGRSTAELRTAGATDGKADASKADAAKADAAKADAAKADAAKADAAKADAAKADAAKADAAKAKADAAEAAQAEAAQAEAAQAKAAAAKAAAAKADKGTGSAAGAASGRSAATATSAPAYTNENSSKASRPNGATTLPGTPSQPLSNADKKGGGANVGTADACARTNPYCSNGTGAEPGNGNDSAPAKGQPCAGCVGKADNKYPKGQAPGGSDHNSGYECDRNQGVGRMNPAHTGCTTPGPVTSTPTKSASPQPTKSASPKPTKSASPQPTATKTPGNGTATVTVAADCRTVRVTSSKDISNVVVLFTDGTSTKFDGLSGKTWTRTFTGKTVASATAKSATTSVTGTATGCGVLPTSTPAPSASACPAGTTMKGNGGCKPADDAKRTVTICHATGSTTSPYVVMTMDESAVAEHRDHRDRRDIIPAPASGVCPTGTPPEDACPDLGGIQVPGTSCTPPAKGGTTTQLCPNGQVMPNGNPVNCPTAPPVCPTSAVMGPVMAGCTPPNGGGVTPIKGGTPDTPASGGLVPVAAPPVVGPPTVGPPTVVPPVIVPHGTRPPVIVGTTQQPATRPAVRPRALPFTGTDAALLAELGALLLLAGGGVLLASRRERTSRVR